MQYEVSAYASSNGRGCVLNVRISQIIVVDIKIFYSIFFITRWIVLVMTVVIPKPMKKSHNLNRN